MHRDDAALEAETIDLGQALIEGAHAPDLPGEADLSDRREIRAEGPVQIARGHGETGGKIRRRFLQRKTSADVDLGIAARHGETAALFQHREQHRGPVIVHPVGAPRRVIGRGCDQSLHLGEDGARPLDDTGDAGAGAVLGPAAQEHFGGVLHTGKAPVRHLKDADLIGGAEAVLCRPQDAEAGAALALKIEHTVHHMLEHLRPRDAALLVDMSHYEDREILFLAKAHDAHRALAHLGDAAGGGAHIRLVYGLDGVDDHDLGLQALRGGEDRVQIRLREDVDLPARDAEAVGAEL